MPKVLHEDLNADISEEATSYENSHVTLIASSDDVDRSALSGDDVAKSRPFLQLSPVSIIEFTCTFHTQLELNKIGVHSATETVQKPYDVRISSAVMRWNVIRQSEKL